MIFLKFNKSRITYPLHMSVVLDGSISVAAIIRGITTSLLKMKSGNSRRSKSTFILTSWCTEETKFKERHEFIVDD